MSESELGKHEPRLGYCEVCDGRAAIYTCPKCEVKTCSLECVRVHKNELNCDGVRDRTKFIRIKDFTDRDYFQDYQMLEDCARFVFAVKRDEKKKFTRIDKDLPIHLFKLKMAARDRGVALQFLAQNFSRHRANTTRYDYKTNLISWRVEWIFANAEPALKMVDQKCLENVKLAVLLNKYLGADSTVEGTSALEPYKGVGFPGIKVLMRAEKLKGCVHKFFELDLDESLAECLSGKCVVEFPTFIVVYKDHAYNFEIITGIDVVNIERTLEDSFLELVKYIKIFIENTSSDTIDARLKKLQYINNLVSLTKVALENKGSGLQEDNENTGMEATVSQASSKTGPLSAPDSKGNSSGLDDSKTENENPNWEFSKGILRSIEQFNDLQNMTFQSKVIQLVTEIKYGAQTPLAAPAPSTHRSPSPYRDHSPNSSRNDFKSYFYCDSQDDFDLTSL